MPVLLSSLNALASVGRLIGRAIGAVPLTRAASAEVAELLRRAGEADRAGRRDEAAHLFRQVLGHRRNDVTALRRLRDLAIDTRSWREALDLAERLVAQVPAGERAREAEWVAIIHYELGRAETERARPAAAIPHFRSALRADRSFVPAVLALGEAHEATGDRREALRAWERAVEMQPALPVLVRLERAYREEGRPSRMNSLYRAAVERAPDDLALAVALGRVYFELEMLDEAADQFEKVEVRAPDLPVVHAFLAAVFERRGETREAFEEYHRALRLSHAFDWPHRCTACGVSAPAWRERCPQCERWNGLRPLGGR
ncbi:MAG TPA: tetratricopeptide repeat protein [Solirubrobacterales bacterium]|nr:tetratricopeptide repeat protein [Solirubrobacterales bacterium]